VFGRFTKIYASMLEIFSKFIQKAYVEFIFKSPKSIVGSTILIEGPMKLEVLIEKHILFPSTGFKTK